MENRDMTQLWREACGETPQGFAHRARMALAALPQGRPRRLRQVFAAALILVLLLGSAYALERLGLLDTLSQALRGSLLPQAQELVKSNIPHEANQPALARFALEEAVYDGHQVYLTLSVKPADPGKILLMDRDAQPAWAADYQTTGNERKGESFAEKAHAAGQVLVQPLVDEISVSGQSFHVHTQTAHYQEDSLLYTLSFPASGEEARVRLHLLAPDIYQPMDASTRGRLDFSISKSPHIKTFAAPTPLELPLAGLTLQHCQLELSPIASYLTLRYALAPDATPLQAVNMADGIWANWLGEDGKPRETGDYQLSLEDQADGGVALTQTFGALEEAPADITLSFYNGMTKERFDQVTLTLSAKEEN